MSRRDKIIFLGLIPVIAAICGALATSLFSGQSCSLGPNTDLFTILSNTTMSSAEKMKIIEIYKEVSDRPWSLVRSLTTGLFISLGFFGVAIAERIRSGGKKSS